MSSEKRSIKSKKVAGHKLMNHHGGTPPPPVTQQNPTLLSIPRSVYPFQLFGPHAEILGMKTLQPPQNTFLTSKKLWDLYQNAMGISKGQ